MSKEEVLAINEKWTDELINDGYDVDVSNGFFINEPFSEEYWNEKIKIVFCNVSAYGYPPEDDHVFSWKIFEKSLIGNNPTIVQTSIFINCLFKQLNGIASTKEDIKRIRQDKDALKETAKKIAYMNLQKEVEDSRRQDDNEIVRFFSYEHNARNQKELMAALEPDIFILTGNIGLKVINELYKGEMNIPKQGMVFHGETLFVHLFHPSTRNFSYEYIFKKADEINNAIKNR
jgi:hypothetical protein